MTYIPVIGLEIHAELLTKTKIFCSCENNFGKSPNTSVCPICAGMPGAMPSLNKEAVTLAIKAGISLNCTINNLSEFDRKNYFYPDLPKAYQITQFYHPLCENGYIQINNSQYRIERIHIEEDAGKLTHNSRKNISLIDFNRCGVPLIEIVTKPDFHTADEVKAFVSKLALILKYSDVCDARLEQGSLRTDVNISLMPENSNQFGTRAEIKNLNSLKAIGQAINYEIKRQTQILDSGENVLLETRRFDEKTEKTFSMRPKEGISDYRYFPEPDIPPLYISDKQIEDIKHQIPKMPDARISEYISKHGISAENAHLIVQNKNFSDFYDSCTEIYPSYKTISNIMLTEINRNLNRLNIAVGNLPFSPKAIADLASMYDEKKISKSALSEIVRIMFETSEAPYDIAKNNNLIMQDNYDSLEKIICKLIEENQALAYEYINGNRKIFAYLMGQLMRSAGKETNPQTAKKMLSDKLNTL